MEISRGAFGIKNKTFPEPTAQLCMNWGACFPFAGPRTWQPSSLWYVSGSSGLDSISLNAKPLTRSSTQTEDFRQGAGGLGGCEWMPFFPDLKTELW